MGLEIVIIEVIFVMMKECKEVSGMCFSEFY